MATKSASGPIGASEDLPTYTASIYGNDITYVRAGSGPAVVLIHGVLGNARSWDKLMRLLARDYTVIAPDLLGHGDSAKPLGDYSLGGHAAVLRDLLDAIGVDAATLVGHSLGGGVAMQFAYLFPDRVDRLVLVASGGLGRELNIILRAPTLPGAEWVLPVLGSAFVRSRGEGLARALRRVGIRGSVDAAEAWRGFATLGSPDARRAFLATIRTVVGPSGQTVSARDRLHLLEDMPTLIVWGGCDRLIPVQHAANAHREIPGSRLVIFSRSGHFPHLSEPDRFAALLHDFVSTTQPYVRHAG